MAARRGLTEPLRLALPRIIVTREQSSSLAEIADAYQWSGLR